MAIISFDPDTLIDYVPAYGGNRRSAEPCVVRMRFVPYRRIQEYSSMITARTKNVTDAEQSEAVTKEIQEKQFTESIESVSGFFIKGRELKTPAELYGLADRELIYELLAAMVSAHKLSEGQRKNS